MFRSATLASAAACLLATATTAPPTDLRGDPVGIERGALPGSTGSGSWTGPRGGEPPDGMTRLAAAFAELASPPRRKLLRSEIWVPDRRAHAAPPDRSVPANRGNRSSRGGARAAAAAGPPASEAVTTPGATALRFAAAQIGKPYRWATAGPDTYDCSGLTLAAWSVAGVSLPHSAAGQFAVVRPVARTELVPGDLVFYHQDLRHVGIYAGAGLIIDAPRQGRPVGLRDLDVMPAVGYGRPSTG